MNSKIAILASAFVVKVRRFRSSASGVEKKLSHIALSQASTTYPVEGRTPASLHRRPKATDVY